MWEINIAGIAFYILYVHFNNNTYLPINVSQLGTGLFPNREDLSIDHHSVLPECGLVISESNIWKPDFLTKSSPFSGGVV